MGLGAKAFSTPSNGNLVGTLRSVSSLPRLAYTPLATREIIRRFSTIKAVEKKISEVEIQNDTPRQFKSGSVLDQLHRTRQLQQRVSRTSAKLEKSLIIGEYSDIRELLEHVYDPTFRAHLSSLSLIKYLASNPGSEIHPDQTPKSITHLFDALSSREITGNAAKDVCVQFLRTHGVLDEGQHGHGHQDLLDTFWRLLDRNLIAGFGANTLKSVRWSQPSRPESAPIKQSSAPAKISQTSLNSTTPQSQTTSTAASSESSHSPKPKRNLTKFECALGKTILPQELPKLFKSSTTWYASRKLDGVRCLVFLDFVVPAHTGDIELHDITTVSRQNNEFTSLEVLKDGLRGLERLPKLSEWLNNDPEVIEHLDDGRVVKRLVLDGEVCVMRPRKQDEKVELVTSTLDSSMTGSAAKSLWDETDLIEDFPSTVSLIKRKTGQIPHPVLYLLDVLSWGETLAQTALGVPGLGKTFRERMEDSKIVAEVFGGSMEGNTGKAGRVVKRLEQRAVGGVEEIDGMIDRASKEGWEGLVLRADKPYQGKRSTSIRKFKQWQDDEYIVKSIDTSKMRLAVDGVFGEHEACSNLWIEHKGLPVSVGSGFTAEQRLRFAKDHTQIVGKQVTIEYFGESLSVGRGDQPSLRFPRIKKIWEDGMRDI